MKHLDLFSGIGGFALAADSVWGNVEHTFCEIDPFCQQVLKKHYPHSTIYGDIRTITADTRSQEQRGIPSERREEVPATGETYLLTGGFPCQPFSQAGRRKGTEDDRHLWPEMLRVIREFKPRWVIGENVAGLLTIQQGMVFEQACADLEGEGYEVQPFVIPAVAVNAPHRRDRVWIIAVKCDGGRRERRIQGRREVKGASKNTPTSFKPNNSDAPNTSNKGLERNGKRWKTSKRRSGFLSRAGSTERTDWNENWLEVAARLCRMDDGIPRRMDRNPRLKALGNAIVPQVAEEIMKAIKEVDL